MSSPTAGEAGTDPTERVVHDLAPGCTLEDVEEGALYLATVNGVVEYGVFVDLSDGVSGLVHESNLNGEYGVGDELVVELVEIRENGDVGFQDVDIDPETVEPSVVAPGDDVDIADLSGRIGDSVHLEGDVVQIKQTPGPTIFSVRDGTGVVPCAAFEAAGVRAHPEIELDDTVRVIGSVEAHEGAT